MSTESQEEQSRDRLDGITRQLKFSKGRDWIVQKAAELAILCDVDIGILMFSPGGRLTSFSSNARVEDIFLRYFDRLDILRGGCSEELEVLCQNLERVKHETEMIEKMAKIQALEEKFWRLKQRQIEVQGKMRYYSPQLESITSVQEAEVHRRFLIEALQKLEELKEKLRQNVQQPSASIEASAAEGMDQICSLGTSNPQMPRGMP
ncbi:agamous-like MADS-box protein AGL66 [Punica granatum]|uniref:Agamous-like MADS-box protein AGL66 n=1 Tax=Punica granatum TaxID=22663 RepID=A0A6P8CF70_PUNGR|nr:agamous-like MADS-box protein AGL66 [Punica granatum]